MTEGEKKLTVQNSRKIVALTTAAFELRVVENVSPESSRNQEVKLTASIDGNDLTNYFHRHLPDTESCCQSLHRRNCKTR